MTVTTSCLETRAGQYATVRQGMLTNPHPCISRQMGGSQAKPQRTPGLCLPAPWHKFSTPQASSYIFSQRPTPDLVFSKTNCSIPVVETASSSLSLIWLVVHNSSLLCNKPPGDAARGYALNTAQPGRMIIALLTALCTRQPPKQRKHELKQGKKEGLYHLTNKLLFMCLESFLAER